MSDIQVLQIASSGGGNFCDDVTSGCKQTFECLFVEKVRAFPFSEKKC